MVTVFLRGGVSIGTLARQAQLAHSCYQRAFQKLYNGNHPQLHIFPTIFQKLNEMSNAMGIDSWKSSKAWYNCFANSNNLRNNHYIGSFHRIPDECIQFIMEQPVFREHMSYAPAKKVHDAEGRIYSEMKSSSCRWNEQVR
jgi:hypothetical protein